MRVVFFGTPQFAAEILLHLIDANVDIVAVVTMPDRPKGRSHSPQPSAVKLMLLECNRNIPIYQPERASTSEFIDVLKALSPDLFIVVGYGEILSDELLHVPRYAAINIHTSLLPSYRGAAPIQRAIMAGEKVMGITVMKMNPKMDAGEIIVQASITVDNEMQFPEVEAKLNQLAKHEILKTIELFQKGQVHLKEQDHSKVSLAKKIRQEDCQIYFSKAAQEIHNQVRALTPKPGAYCILTINQELFKLKIYKSKVHSYLSGYPGEIVEFSKKKIIIACQKGAIELLEMQLEGKSKVVAQQFYAGYYNKDLSFQYP